MKCVLIALLVCLTFAVSSLAQEEERADTTFRIGSNWRFELDPNDQPYPDYVADPRRPRMLVGVGVADSEIPETSSGRVMLDLGTRYTLFRIHAGSASRNEFALDIEGGLFTQFDLGRGLDNIGWDGRYGIFAVWDWNDRIATRVGYRHISAHLGDEYIEATGRARIDYTRDDLAFGLSYFLNERFTIYVEPSWAWHMGNTQRQEPWAIEGGLNYEGPRKMWNGSTAFYAATHLRAFDETDWNPGVSVQTGLHVKRSRSSSNLRLGLEGYIGRAILGEFALDYDEAYLTLGIFFDFY